MNQASLLNTPTLYRAHTHTHTHTHKHTPTLDRAHTLESTQDREKMNVLVQATFIPSYKTVIYEEQGRGSASRQGEGLPNSLKLIIAAKTKTEATAYYQ